MAVVQSSKIADTGHEPIARRWSRDEYYQMSDAGLFHDQRVQLIQGEIVHMSPMRAPHARTIELVRKAMESAFGEGHWIRTQLPLFLSENSEPGPDVAVVSGDPRDDASDHPRTAKLVVEVSDATLRFDRTVKRRLYAASAIPEYWIVNLVEQRLEVFHEPADGDYQVERVVQVSGSIRPQSVDKDIRVEDLLP